MSSILQLKKRREKKMKKASETKVFKTPRIGVKGAGSKRSLKKREGRKSKAENFPNWENIHLRSRCSTNSKLNEHKEIVNLETSNC